MAWALFVTGRPEFAEVCEHFELSKPEHIPMHLAATSAIQSNMSPLELVASAAYILVHYIVMQYKRLPRFWQADMYKKRKNDESMVALKSLEIMGYYKNFTPMSSVEFEH
ncbi:hypothetical protein EVAR_86503_1 [Eumeta japonica]|uniref:Uncharacterized protein n=1 Tax=Eumeta variegata TaxID=151549 RepID=A0A4C1VPS8_EUMVA|nr:hypothetical protein EVAR_86503_1 [Eumeta japonica]